MPRSRVGGTRGTEGRSASRWLAVGGDCSPRRARNHLPLPTTHRNTIRGDMRGRTVGKGARRESLILKSVHGALAHPTVLSQRCAARWLGLFQAPGVALSSLLCAWINPRARGTPGSQRTHGPRPLAGPRRPGGEPGVPGFSSGRCSYEWVAAAASLPVPRHPARGGYRLAPRDPRWAYSFRLLPLRAREPTHRLKD